MADFHRRNPPTTSGGGVWRGVGRGFNGSNNSDSRASPGLSHNSSNTSNYSGASSVEDEVRKKYNTLKLYQPAVLRRKKEILVSKNRLAFKEELNDIDEFQVALSATGLEIVGEYGLDRAIELAIAISRRCTTSVLDDKPVPTSKPAPQSHGPTSTNSNNGLPLHNENGQGHREQPYQRRTDDLSQTENQARANNRNEQSRENQDSSRHYPTATGAPGVHRSYSGGHHSSVGHSYDARSGSTDPLFSRESHQQSLPRDNNDVRTGNHGNEPLKNQSFHRRVPHGPSNSNTNKTRYERTSESSSNDYRRATHSTGQNSHQERNSHSRGHGMPDEHGRSQTHGHDIAHNPNSGTQTQFQGPPPELIRNQHRSMHNVQRDDSQLNQREVQSSRSHVHGMHPSHNSSNPARSPYVLHSEHRVPSNQHEFHPNQSPNQTQSPSNQHKRIHNMQRDEVHGNPREVRRSQSFGDEIHPNQSQNQFHSRNVREPEHVMSSNQHRNNHNVQRHETQSNPREIQRSQSHGHGLHLNQSPNQVRSPQFHGHGMQQSPNEIRHSAVLHPTRTGMSPNQSPNGFRQSPAQAGGSVTPTAQNQNAMFRSQQHATSLDRYNAPRSGIGHPTPPPPANSVSQIPGRPLPNNNHINQPISAQQNDAVLNIPPEEFRRKAEESFRSRGGPRPGFPLRGGIRPGLNQAPVRPDGPRDRPGMSTRPKPPRVKFNEPLIRPSQPEQTMACNQIPATPRTNQSLPGSSNAPLKAASIQESIVEKRDRVRSALAPQSVQKPNKLQQFKKSLLHNTNLVELGPKRAIRRMPPAAPAAESVSATTATESVSATTVAESVSATTAAESVAENDQDKRPDTNASESSCSEESEDEDSTANRIKKLIPVTASRKTNKPEPEVLRKPKISSKSKSSSSTKARPKTSKGSKAKSPVIPRKNKSTASYRNRCTVPETDESSDSSDDPIPTQGLKRKRNVIESESETSSNSENETRRTQHRRSTKRKEKETDSSKKSRKVPPKDRSKITAASSTAPDKHASSRTSSKASNNSSASKSSSMRPSSKVSNTSLEKASSSKVHSKSSKASVNLEKSLSSNKTSVPSTSKCSSKSAKPSGKSESASRTSSKHAATLNEQFTTVVPSASNMPSTSKVSTAVSNEPSTSSAILNEPSTSQIPEIPGYSVIQGQPLPAPAPPIIAEADELQITNSYNEYIVQKQKLSNPDKQPSRTPVFIPDPPVNPRGNIIGIRDTVVNVDLGKIKLEHDYVPPSSIKTERVSTDSRIVVVEDDLEQQMEALFSPDPEGIPFQSNHVVVEEVDIPASDIEEPMDLEEVFGTRKR